MYAQTIQPQFQSDIRGWCIKRLKHLLGFDDVEDIVNFVFSIDSAEELEEYIGGLLGRERPAVNKFLRTLISKRKATSITFKDKKVHQRVVSSDVGDGLQAYRKGERYSGGGTTTTTTTTPTTSTTTSTTSTKQSTGKRKKRRKQKPITLETFQGGFENLIVPGRVKCDCQATRHDLIGSCSWCGRIICSQEGPGRCLFCGRDVLSNNNHQAAAAPSDPSLCIAIENKDRLLRYDREAARRTHVYDDQSDYFASDNRWLSPDERKAIEKEERRRAMQREDDRRKVSISIDFAGRLITKDESKDGSSTTAIDEELLARLMMDVNVMDHHSSVANHSDHHRDAPQSIYANPSLKQDAPMFRKDAVSTNDSTTSASTSGPRRRIEKNIDDDGGDNDDDDDDDGSTMSTRAPLKRGISDRVQDEYFTKDGGYIESSTSPLVVHPDAFEVRALMERMENHPENPENPIKNLLSMDDCFTHYFLLLPSPIATTTTIPHDDMIRLKRITSMCQDIGVTLVLTWEIPTTCTTHTLSAHIKQLMNCGDKRLERALRRNVAILFNGPELENPGKKAYAEAAKIQKDIFQSISSNILGDDDDDGTTATTSSLRCFVAPLMWRRPVVDGAASPHAKLWNAIACAIPPSTGSTTTTILFGLPCTSIPSHYGTHVKRFFPKHKIVLVDDFPLWNEPLPHLHPYVGRPASIRDTCAGIALALPNHHHHHHESSLIPLRTFMDFMCSPFTYDPESSLRSALRSILGGHDKMVDAIARLFGYFPHSTLSFERGDAAFRAKTFSSNLGRQQLTELLEYIQTTMMNGNHQSSSLMEGLSPHMELIRARISLGAAEQRLADALSRNPSRKEEATPSSNAAASTTSNTSNRRRRRGRGKTSKSPSEEETARMAQMKKAMDAWATTVKQHTIEVATWQNEVGKWMPTLIPKEE